MKQFFKTGVILATGASIFALRSKLKKKCHPTIVTDYPELYSHFPELCADVSMLSTLNDESSFRSVLDMLDAIRYQDVGHTHDAPRNIALLSSRIIHFLESVIERHKRGTTDEEYRASMYCNDFVLPELKMGLENILHNHMLQRDASVYVK